MGLLQPTCDMRQARDNRVNVPGGDFHVYLECAGRSVAATALSSDATLRPAGDDPKRRRRWRSAGALQNYPASLTFNTLTQKIPRVSGDEAFDVVDHLIGESLHSFVAGPCDVRRDD